MKVFVPTGQRAIQSLKPAPSLSTLRSRRILLLDNGKWNGGKILRFLGELLEAREPGLTTHFERKAYFSRVAEPEMIERLASGTDAVITALGD